MDTKQDFQNWGETVKNWDDSSKVKSKSLNVRIKPNMYNIMIIFDKLIPNSFFVNIFSKFFQVEKNGTKTLLKSLINQNKIAFGSFTKEVAEYKATSIMKFSRNKGFSLKCTITKDDNYAVEKS